MKSKLQFTLVLFFAAMSTSLCAQLAYLNDDFEGNGTIGQWVEDDVAIDTDFANPHVNTDNPSSTVMRYFDFGGTWTNVRFTNSDKFDLNTGSTFTFKIYIESSSLTGNSPNQVSLKLQNADLGQPWVTQTEIIKPVILDQWQTVTIDFSSGQHQNFDANSGNPMLRTDLDRVLIQLNGEGNNDQLIAYIDDFDYDGFLGELPYDPDLSNSIFDQLVWSDEFEIDGAVDPTKWHHQTQLPFPSGWFNGELQHYTDDLDNSYVSNGELHIKAKREFYLDQGLIRNFTSARLNSKFAFTYGRVEVRAKLPTGGGTWPAIWMLGKNINEAGTYWQPTHGSVSWPACGEIDIMEHWGWNQDYCSSAIHTPASFGGTQNYGGQNLSSVSDNFYVYGMEWDEEEIRFTVNGIVHYTYHPVVQDASTWPFFEDQFFLLNVAIEGNAPDASWQESEMVIDYIRVYQESACCGDIDGDNDIDVDDFLDLNSVFGSTCSGCPEDLTGDGLVDINDFLDLNSQYGAPCN